MWRERRRRERRQGREIRAQRGTALPFPPVWAPGSAPLTWHRQQEHEEECKQKVKEPHAGGWEAEQMTGREAELCSLYEVPGSSRISRDCNLGDFRVIKLFISPVHHGETPGKPSGGARTKPGRGCLLAGTDFLSCTVQVGPGQNQDRAVSVRE